ncbi:MAG: exodeoxyribonuclease VII large subunit [Ruminococcus sp.]|nr:exodeoxyribonuclease VII large subunit [Ruminococcus sp.]
MSSILTVSQITRYLKSKFISDLKLKGIAIKGEILDYSVNYRSGNVYFSLKDEGALLKCMMFSDAAERLKFQPEDGLSVLAVGNISIYDKGGIYQLYVSQLSPLGIGEAKLGLDQLKNKLAEKGVFDTSRKKPIPIAPQKLAVVTSPTGAAIQDIIKVLTRRYPVVKLEIYPAAVQGAEAPKSLAEALKRADKSGADTIIITRGGGSDEDLMAFNTELLTMAVYECKTPVISAVGHEIDTTLCDYASDLRAPTPSAAAEQATPDIAELYGAVDLVKAKLDHSIGEIISKSTSELELAEASLKLNSPERKVTESITQLSRLSDKLGSAMNKILDGSSSALDGLALQLGALSPFGVLDRGYTIITKDNSAVTSAGRLNEGDNIIVRFSDGKAEAEIKKVIKDDI